MKKLFNTLLFLALSCVTAMAIGKNEVTIKSFKVIPGQEATVEVAMDNEDNISSLQFDVYFPKGLSFVEESEAKDPVRFPSKRTHALDATHHKDLPSNAIRFTLLTIASDMKKSAINGNSGTIVTFKVKAAEDFKDGNIEMNTVIGSDGTRDDGHAVKIDMPDQTVPVYANVGTFTSENAEVIVNSKESSELYFHLDNTIKIAGIQFDVTLPQGVSLVDSPIDNECITYTDRINENFQAMSNEFEPGTTRFVICAVTGDAFYDNSGRLFALNFKCTDEFETGDIKITNIRSTGCHGDEHLFDDITINCMSDVAAGVNKVNVDTEEATAIYNLQGVKTDKLNKGINIVVKGGKAIKVVK